MDLLFLLEALVLNFEVEVAAAEDVLVLGGHGFCGGVILFTAQVLVLSFAEQCFAQLAAEAAGEADEALGMFGEVGLADAGLAVEAVEGGLGGDADEVAVALFIGGKDEEVIVIVAFARGAVVFFLGDVEFAAEDGLDAVFFGGVEEVDGAIDVAMVGHGDGFLAEGGDAVDEFRRGRRLRRGGSTRCGDGGG